MRPIGGLTAKLLSKDEARRIAANMAKLPDTAYPQLIPRISLLTRRISTLRSGDSSAVDAAANGFGL
jgi:hypothetical protein